MNKIRAFWRWAKLERCKLFGHSFNTIDKVMFEIKMSAINREDFIRTAHLKCTCCGAIFVHKDNPIFADYKIGIENKLIKV